MSKNVPNLRKLEIYRIMKMQLQHIVVFSTHLRGMKRQKSQPRHRIVLHLQCTISFPLFQGKVLAESKERVTATLIFIDT